MKVDDVKVGDVIWQSRAPGGYCIYMGPVTKETSKLPSGWLEVDEPVYLILHPSEGLIEDPSYYYHTLEEQDRIENRIKSKKTGL